MDIIENTLDELRYEVSTKVIDARHYVPQHRERIFIVGFNRDLVNTDNSFEFPAQPDNNPTLRPIITENANPKYTLSDKLWNYLQEYARKHRERGNGFGYGLVDLDGVSRTLSARYHKDGAEILIPQGRGINPRRLMPIECRDLMGYPENFEIEDIGVSDTQLYRQFGNSVAVPVVEVVAENVVKYLNVNRLNLDNVADIDVNYPIVEDPQHRNIA